MEDYQVLSTCIVGLAAFLLTVKYFRRPHNQPPGPFSFPVIGSLHAVVFTKLSVQDRLLEFSKIYGTVFRIKLGALNMIILNDYKTIKEAYHHPNLIDRPTAGIEFLEKEMGGGKIMGAASGEMWREQRKFMFNLFREFGVNKTKFEDVILEEAEPFLKEIESLEGKDFDPTALTANAVTNIICGVSLGKRFEYNSSEFDYLLMLMAKTMEATDQASAVAIFPILQYVPYPPIKNSVKYMREFFDWITDFYNHHLNNFDEYNCDDLMDGFLRENKKWEAKQDHHKMDIFNDKNMIATLSDLFFAGSETTATTLRWGFLYFVQNPNVQQKFQTELDDVVGRDRMPKLSDREEMPYVRATIAEIQRHARVAPLGVPHAASVDTQIFGYTFPKGSMIVSNLNAALMDPKIWPEPEKFKPERYLDEGGKFVIPHELIPFSVGPRECMGAALAKMELFVFLTHLLHRFNLSAPKGESLDNVKGTFGLFRKPENYSMCFVPRE